MQKTPINFEKIHEEFDGMMFDLCDECGGRCEKNNLSLYLPGEVEFIAGKLKINFKDFVKKYCNLVKISENSELYIQKAGTCPFLDNDYRCTLEKPNCKIIRCMLYPVLIGHPTDKFKIFLDYEDCPMANKLTDQFKKQAFKIYEDIRDTIPEYWLEFVSKYDFITYDYSKLEKLRDKEIITPEELEKCAISSH
ncbi:MAG: hypothetical protein WC737_04505 [Parcubacteria group bacterium]|jgi:Fe-S-cluster containining protein